jgi:hypothetical protein
LSHPNLLPVIATRPVMSSNTMALVELGLATLVDAGFTLDRSRQVINVFVAFAIGHALTEVGASPLMFDGYDPNAVAEFRTSSATRICRWSPRQSGRRPRPCRQFGWACSACWRRFRRTRAQPNPKET